MKKLSIVIPIYNEKNTLRKLLAQAQAVELPLVKEIIMVDDGSTDGTREILTEIARETEKESVKIFFQKKNQGKGAAVKRGFLAATGDFIIIQDADLEYDPKQYEKLLDPIQQGEADVVYGSRLLSSEAHRVLFFWHSVGNKFLTTLSNMFTDLNLTDMETCYKVFRREVLDSFKHKLESKRFGIEPELTAYVAKGKWRVYEVGIAYRGRTYAEGKKINWKDGLAAIWYIFKYNLFK